VNTFTPPATSTVPSVLPPGAEGQTPLQYRLWRHYRSRPEGVNVYVLSDGTVTEDDPDQETSFWYAPDGNPYVKVAFYGGHDAYEITDEIAALLVSQGYTVGEEPGPPIDPEEPPPTPSANSILTEAGDTIITEDGATIVQEA
jgi:hypothetical protein